MNNQPIPPGNAVDSTIAPFALNLSKPSRAAPKVGALGDAFLPTTLKISCNSREGVALRACNKSSLRAKTQKVRNKTPTQWLSKHAIQSPPINPQPNWLHPPAHQSGAVLVVSLIMLLLLTLIGITGMQTTSLEEKMAGNMRDRDLAFQAAESALKAAEATLNPVAPAVLPTFVAAGTGGFYSATPTPDLSETEIVKDSFWTTNPVATSTVTGLGNGIATPKYIIQVMEVADCPGAAIGSLGCTNYRITARATGGTTSAVVILESIYSR